MNYFDHEAEEKNLSLKLEVMTTISAMEFWKIKSYLQREYRDGKTDFRISFQSERHFIIHPMDKDGETIDVRF
jgi:hypothetical protein